MFLAENYFTCGNYYTNTQFCKILPELRKQTQGYFLYPTIQMQFEWDPKMQS